MGFLEELEWRGMLFDKTPGAELQLKEGPQIAYIGFDPTAPSMTIGNYVQVMLLKLWQLAGHTPIVLMGGATGRIGDPSGKDQERQLKSFEELDSNLQRQIDQVKKFLDFDEGPNKALIINNLEFYKEMNVLDFLRNIGKTLTVNYMMSKDSVKNRLETGLSFTEFSYQLLQAYDFQHLYESVGCRFQMGGSDQWGNITSGTEFIRKNLTDAKAFAITTPLLTKADGKKFGKSEEGNIWMSSELTSSYKFYQFWLNIDDADLPSFTRYFTLKSKDEVEALEAEHADNPNALKKILSEELTRRVHSDEAFEAAQKVSELLFNKKATQELLFSMPEDALEIISEEIPSYKVNKSVVAGKSSLLEFISEQCPIVASKGEAKRAIKNNAISVNKEKVTSDDFTITSDHLLKGKYVLIENGKKNKYMVLAE